MFRKVINLALVLVMVLTSSGIALAKADDGPQTPQAAAARGQAKSYIVVLAQDPVATYEGEIAGYQATKPGKGGKINPNSAHGAQVRAVPGETAQAGAGGRGGEPGCPG